MTVQRGDYGKIAIVWRGTWRGDYRRGDTAGYERLDAVFHEGSSYIAVENTGPAEVPGKSAKWQLMAKAADYEVIAAKLKFYPVPGGSDEGKTLMVQLTAEGEPSLRFVDLSSGMTNLVVPLNDASGTVSVRYAEHGLPDRPATVYPVLEVLAGRLYHARLKTASKTGFTAQVYRPDGTPGIDVPEFITLGIGVRLGEGRHIGDPPVTIANLLARVPA